MKCQSIHPDPTSPESLVSALLADAEQRKRVLGGYQEIGAGFYPPYWIQIYATQCGNSSAQQ